MHHTDRTQQFMEFGGYQAEAYAQPGPQGEYGAPTGEYEAETLQEWQGEAYGQMEVLGELIHPVTGEVNAEAEMALAAELLSVSNEQELNHFLGGLIRNAGKAFGKFARSGLGRTVGTALRGVAKTVLPFAGGALGSLIPIPGVGTAIGTAVGTAAASALEFEGLSQEDRQFELARRVVRIGVESARALNNLPESEFMSEQEILSTIANVARSVLPSIGNAVLSGFSGQAAGAGQANGGLSGGLQVSSPGGWNVSVGGQAGGQFQGAGTVGVNTAAPPMPQQPRPGMPVRPQVPPQRPAARPGTPSCRRIRRGRDLIVILSNVY